MIIRYCFLLLGALCIFSCSEKTEYPALYKYESIEDSEKHFRILTTSGHVEIDKSVIPAFYDVDNIASNVVDELFNEVFGIEEVTLENENEYSMVRKIDGVSSEINGTYEVINDELYIDGNRITGFIYESNEDEFQYCLEIFLPLLKNQSGFPHLSDCTTTDYETIIASYDALYSFVPGDTLGIILPRLIYSRQ